MPISSSWCAWLKFSRMMAMYMLITIMKLMMIKLVKYVIASRGEPQSPFGWFLYVGLQAGGCTISDSNTSFHPADVISLQIDIDIFMTQTYCATHWNCRCIFLRSTNKMQRYTIFVYCCQCSTCIERVFRSSSGAQKLYKQHRVLVKLVCCDC